MKTVITVSRKWNNPEIMTMIHKEGIARQMTMADFIEALAKEIGPVTWVVKQETFNRILAEAAGRVVAGMKDESAKVV